MADTSSLRIEVVSVGIKEASQQLGGLSTSANNAEKRVQKLTDTIASLTGVQKTATAAAQQYANAIQSTYNNIAGGSGATSTLAAATTKLGEAMLVLSQSLQSVGTRATQARQAIVQNTAAMQDAHAMARGLSGSLGVLWVTYGNMIPLAAGLAIGTAMKEVVSVGKDVEHTLEAIRVKGGETVESVNAIRTAVYNLGSGIYGPKEVAAAFETMILAGLNATEALQGVKAALNLATAGGGTIEKAAESLVSIGTAVGATAKDYDYLADGIAKAANVSMASVDSIAETVKRASAVNKLYGVSFEDLLTHSAALAQLGIKNTAAGTAILNAYADMQGKTEKAKKALDELGMSFSDNAGRAKPMVQAFEEFSTKLNEYARDDQKQFIIDIFGKQAQRDIAAVVDLTRQAADDSGKYANKLEELQGKVQEMAGTAAIASVQMALTTENQLKSMGNTLQVTFAKVFQEIEPQVNIFAMRMREVFADPAFISGIAAIAKGLGNIAVALAENIKLVGYLVEAFITFKFVTLGQSLFEGVAAGLLKIAANFGTVTAAAEGAKVVSTALGTVTIAANGAATAATGLGIALRFLPGIGIILSGLTAAWALYNLHSSQAKDNAVNTAKAYNENYLEALREEADRLKKTNDLIAAGVEIRQAETQAIKEQSLEKARLQNRDSIISAAKELDRVQNVYKEGKNGKYYAKGEAVPKDLAAAQQAYANALKMSNDFEIEAAKLTNTVVTESEKKRQAYIATTKAQEAAATAAAGSKHKAIDDPAGVSDAFRAQLTVIQGEVEAAKREFQSTTFTLQQQEKAGAISKLEMIQKVSAAEVKMYSQEIAAYEKQIDLAGTAENKRKLTAELENKIAAAKAGLNEADIKAKQQTAVAIADIEKQTTQNQIAELEARGQYVAAAELKYQDSYEKEIASYGRMADELRSKMLTAEFMDDAKGAEEFAKQLEAVEAYLTSITTKAEAFKHAAEFKEADEQFKSLLAGVDAALAEVDRKLSNKGTWWDKFLAQDKLDYTIKQQLPALEAALKRVQEAVSNGTATDAEVKKYNEDLANYKKLLNQQGRSYKEFIETVVVAEGREAFEALASNVSGSWSRYIDKLKANFKKLIIDWLYEQLAKPFVISVVGQFAGMLGMPSMASAASSMLGGSSGGASGSGGVGSLISAASSANSLYSMVSGGNAALIGGAQQGVQSGMNFLSGSGGYIGQGPMQISGTAQVLGTGAAYLGGAMLGRTIGSAISQGFETSIIGGQAAVNIGTAIGAAVGGPIGAVIGGVAGGLFNRAFGHGETEIRSKGIRGTMSNAGTSGVSYVNKHEDGGWFTGDNDWTDTSSIDSKVATQMANGFNALKASSESFAAAVGVSTGALNGYSKAFDITLTDDAQANQQAITDFFTKMGDEMALKLVPNLVQFSKTGETASAVLQRLSEDFTATNAMAQLLGKTAVEVFGSMDMASASAREYLIQLAGSSSALLSKVSAYSQEYLTDAEKLVPVQKAVTAAMKSLGLSSITTKEQFKSYVNSLDLTNQAQADLFNKLMDLAPAFAQVANAANTAAQAALDQANANVDKARTGLTDAYNRESQAITATQTKFTDFAKSLREFQTSLMTGNMSPLTISQKYAQAAANYNDIVTKANAGDQDAISKFQSVANEFLNISREYNASGAGYTADFNNVATETSHLASISEHQADLATASLEALNKQVQGLIDVNQSVLTVAQAIVALQNAMAAAGTAKAVVDGSHANGLSYVPFDGYRAELHKGERVLTANENKEYQLNLSNYGRGANEALVNEIKALREEVAQLRKDQADQTGKMIVANYDANERAASNVVSGVGGAISETSWKERSKPELV